MDRKSIIKLFIAITCSIILFYFIVEKLSGFSNYETNILDNDISVQIKHPDGTVNYYDSNSFPLVNKGDVVLAKVNLPKDRYIKNGALCFYTNHSIVDIYDSNNNLEYIDGNTQENEDEMIGGTVVFLHIPEEAWGKFYTIELKVQENRAFSRIQDVMVLNSMDSYKYIIGGKEAELMLFLTVFVSSVVVLFVLVFNWKWDSIMRQGVFLLLFLSLLSIWALGHSGILDLLLNNNKFINNMEYIAMFSWPMMLSLFFFEQNKRRTSKRMHFAFAVMYGVFTIICILLNYTTMNYHYYKMVMIYRILLALGIIAEFYISVRHTEKDNISIQALKCGETMFLVVVFIELIKKCLDKYANFDFVDLTQNITYFGLIILIVSVVLSYTVQLTNHYVSEYEKRNLEKMAYYDVLTGIANRAGCYKYFEELNYSKDNALVFIDVNKLKYANDVFGHEMGDMLIRVIAETLEFVFKNHGFYGRFGGDEFIAIVSSKKIEKVYEYMDTFDKVLDNINKKRAFPFKVSVSYGISISTKDNPISIEELIKNADNKMYENKKKSKMERK